MSADDSNPAADASPEVPVRLAITGATGRMGGELRQAAADREDVTAVLAADRVGALEELDPDGAGGTDPTSGATLGAAADLADLLDEHDVDVLVDFTVAEACVPAVEAAAENGVAAVVGTTGFDHEELADLRGASESVPVLKAANFARGVQVLLDVVGRAVEGMDGYDAELLETHHSAKRDAPSGTAKRILREVEEARGEPSGAEQADADESESGDADESEPGDATDGESGATSGDTDAELERDRVHGREGHAPRSDGEVGVHAVRAGDVTGIHELLLAGNHEELRITHRAEDRGVFAAGALDAAAWLAGREPGWYEFSDVLGGE